jgi:hypothetical protein
MYDLMVEDPEFGWITVDGFETHSDAEWALLEEMQLTGNSADLYRIIYVG